MLFAEKIKSLREERKLLQRELAAALDIDVPMYSRIERGERPIKREQIKLIADILEYDERELLKLWLADQVSAVLDGDNEIINDVLDIAKMDLVKNNERHRILSLFSNIGVGEAYLKELGFNVVVANEINDKRAALYQKIYPDTLMVCGDITDETTYKKIIEQSLANDVDIVMATPPCQGMSTAGKQQKFDKRNNLFLYAIYAIEEIKPKYFIFENVPGLLTTQIEYNNTIHTIPEVINKKIGKLYNISFKVVNAQNYDVPQSRERVIILGTRKDISKTWSMPEPSEKLITLEDAIGWIPIIDPFVKDISQEDFLKMYPKYEERKEQALKISHWNHPTSHVLRNVIAMQHTPTGCTAFDNDKYKPLKKDGTIVRGFKNTYKRQNWNTPGYTIAMDNIEISSQNNVHPGRFIGKDTNGYDIYSDARAMTLYELMIIMSIPEYWPVPKSTSPVFLRKVIGEGVPPMLIKKIFMQLK